jgi:putative ABC transport system permease protein
VFGLMARLRAQGRRAAAMLVSVGVAVAAFLVLTASAERSSLELTETVDANFRSSYDLLVRPKGSQTSMEREAGLVRPNYLSGIYGGITRRQLHRVEAVPGVDVAAPIAMIGTILASVKEPVDLSEYVGAHGRALLRYSTTYVSQRGQSRAAGQFGYVYVTDGALRYHSARPPYGHSEKVAGRQVMVCPEPDDTGSADSPFSEVVRWRPWCWSRSNGIFGSGWTSPSVAEMNEGAFGAVLTWSFPITLAAIDPVAEAKLTGIDEAVVDGRFLDEGEQETEEPSAGGGPVAPVSVPVVLAKDALVDEQAHIAVDRLPESATRRLIRGISVDRARPLIREARGEKVAQLTIDANNAYSSWRDSVGEGSGGWTEAYWTPSAVTYATTSAGHLRPHTEERDSSVWQSPVQWNGWVGVPADAADTAYRTLTQHRSDAEAVPTITTVGTFDTAKLPGFSSLSEVPLETYQPPSATPADERTRRLLGGHELLPNLNPAGYLQAPPLALTTLTAADSFTKARSFADVDDTAPISVIRIKVGGVTGTDDVSRQRIELVANRIREATGLDVDVTIGSSPAPQQVDLPASASGASAMSITEKWTKKGVAFALVDRIDRKSLLLFLLILAASALTVLNAASASVRARRTQFGVLACVGWRPAKLYRSVCADLAILGTLAGGLGALAAVPLGMVVDSPMSWERAALAVPTAVVLTVLAGLYPAWLAAHADPAEAVRPAVRPVRRARRLHRIGSLALAAVARTPARTAAGAAALALGVCALGVLLGIVAGFHGAAVGTLLGDAIAVQVHGSDIVAGVVIGVLALIGLADILYLDLHEQAPRYASLQASGWRDGDLARLIVTQAALIATPGGLLGAAAAAVILQVLGALTASTLLVVAGVGAAGVLLSGLVALAPAVSLTRLDTASILAQE